MSVTSAAAWRARHLGLALLLASALPLRPADAQERLGTVRFEVSCAPAVHGGFNRGVALLHDFWYEEARPQFEAIVKRDPGCAMAHWGVAMSLFHQIWDRPDEATLAAGWHELQAAEARPAGSARERGYVAALAAFYRPGARDYQARIEAYSSAMGRLHEAYPGDVDAAAFYALSLLAAEAPTDTSLSQERRAMTVLVPLRAANPDHPGLVHYIIHACDNPALAPQALEAARAYGKIAPAGPHAVHMPGHIFARLGLWPEDIAANAASVQASRAAESRHESGWMDQFHADDFLVYAYLQSGQEARAAAVIEAADAAMTRYGAMPGMAPDHYMSGMFPYYRAKLPVFFALETRDWPKALELEPIAGAPPETQTQIEWARAIAAGHLHRAADAGQALSSYDEMIAEIRRGRHAYYAEGTAAQIRRGEIVAWSRFAAGDTGAALEAMRAAADLQDRVGQGEVDVPAREMLADMLLDARRPADALGEYRADLRLSPNRFNGLYGAAQAAEAAGDGAAARGYYGALLASTANGAGSRRAEIAHAKAFLSQLTITPRESSAQN